MRKRRGSHFLFLLSLCLMTVIGVMTFFPVVAPQSCKSSISVFLMPVILTAFLAVGSCGRQAAHQSVMSGQILDSNSTNVPQEGHLFGSENVLTSFVKLSQERSGMLDRGPSSNLTVEEKWVSTVNFISSLTTMAIKASLPLSVSLTYEKNVSIECSASLLKILSGVRQNQAPALSCK